MIKANGHTRINYLDTKKSHDTLRPFDWWLKDGTNVNFKLTSNIRLSGGNSQYEGQLEVELNIQAKDEKVVGSNHQYHQWLPVCGDGWNLVSALVTCRQLNYGYATYALQDTFSTFQNFQDAKEDQKEKKKYRKQQVDTSYESNLPILMVACSGNELQLSQCNLTLTSTSNCSHPYTGRVNAAGVICTSGQRHFKLYSREK